MEIDHTYSVTVEWTGNHGSGTSSYRAYGRDHLLRAAGKPDLLGSADRAFRGSPERWNPEELLVAALNQCHMLSYLHLAANAGVIVTQYRAKATGTMRQTADGGGQFTEVILRPEVTIAGPEHQELANALHDDAHRLCFIARSVNFPVLHQPRTQLTPAKPA